MWGGKWVSSGPTSDPVPFSPQKVEEVGVWALGGGGATPSLPRSLPSAEPFPKPLPCHPLLFKELNIEIFHTTPLPLSLSPPQGRRDLSLGPSWGPLPLITAFLLTTTIPSQHPQFPPHSLTLLFSVACPCPVLVCPHLCPVLVCLSCPVSDPTSVPVLSLSLSLPVLVCPSSWPLPAWCGPRGADCRGVWGVQRACG